MNEERISRPGFTFDVPTWEREIQDGWRLVDARRIEALELNAYGTLFGGRLLASAVSNASSYLTREMIGQTLRQIPDFLFESAAFSGEHIHVLLRPIDRAGATQLECQILCGPAGCAVPLRRVASGVLVAGPTGVAGARVSSGEWTAPGEGWHMTLSRWIIRRDCDYRGVLRTEHLLEVMDEAAVSYCREQTRVGRLVTKKFHGFKMLGHVQNDDTLRLYFRTTGTGRSSIQVECAVVRAFSRRHGVEETRVAEDSFVMVATDEQGRPTRHALSRDE